MTRRRRFSIQDLAGERFILLNEMHCLGEQVLNFCRANECQPLIACRSAQIGTIQSLIALKQGVLLLPDMARRADQSRTIVIGRWRKINRVEPSLWRGTATTITARWPNGFWPSCVAGLRRCKHQSRETSGKS